MRRYRMNEDNKLESIVCNKCGRSLKVEEGYLKEGCFHSDFVFGYFSGKDGIRHSFDLCEKCYDEWIAGFEVPVEAEDEKELL